MEIDDGTLVARARGGDPEAFRALVERHQHALYAFVRSRVEDPTEAEDVSQEVFVAAWRGLPGLAAPARFAAWLFGIARRQVRDHRRGAARRSTVPEARLDECPAPEALDGPLVGGESLDELLAGLEDRARVVLVLRFREGRTYREIAAALGLPVGTVGTILHRALRRLVARGCRGSEARP